ncbi:hypothetical protein UMZ34_24355 [Halopseudomonas pachastrellae]|nr:hypothetical protein UMZ34_24355 [Halopseudomonas pachastrellae]
MAQTPDTATDPNDVSHRITPAYRRYALFILVLAYTSSHVDRNIVGILIEPLKADLLLSDTQLGFLSGIAFALFYATLASRSRSLPTAPTVVTSSPGPSPSGVP